MENSIFEIIKASKTQFEELKKKKKERCKQYQEELQKQYVDGVLIKFGITKEDAINMKLNDVKTINKIYYKNINYFKNVARRYCYSRRRQIIEVEDIINQIYIDLRY